MTLRQIRVYTENHRKKEQKLLKNYMYFYEIHGKFDIYLDQSELQHLQSRSGIRSTGCKLIGIEYLLTKHNIMCFRMDSCRNKTRIVLETSWKRITGKRKITGRDAQHIIHMTAVKRCNVMAVVRSAS